MKIIILMGLAILLLSLVDMLFINVGYDSPVNFLTICIVMLLIIFVTAISQ